jgi:choline dehydrogenase
MFDPPRHANTVIIGGGTAGSVLAGRLAEQSDESIVLLEAGPDYGPFDRDAWPEDLLDASHIARSHQWGYTSGTNYPDRTVQFDRAKVVGGCSAHNGCAAIWGSRLDYDSWAASGCSGWSTEELLPFFTEASERLRVRIPTSDELQPFHRAFLAAAPNAGIQIVQNLNDLDQDQGMAPSPANIWNGVRWNAAFAYLDRVRGSKHLTIVGGSLVDRIVIDRHRAEEVVFHTEDGSHSIAADRVIVSAGTYESPSILMRSGVGASDMLTRAGIDSQLHLPGVGQNLHDHPAVELAFEGTEELKSQMHEFRSRSWLPEEQTIAKVRTSVASEGFDLHIYPVGSPYAEQSPDWGFFVPVACMTPRSRGSLSIHDSDPTAHPILHHGYLDDADGHDRSVLVEGVEIARRLTEQPELKGLLGREIAPGLQGKSKANIAAWVDQTVIHYYHPVGTCKMGSESDPTSVVDPRGRVLGLDNLYVADCSIIPTIPRANTNLPAAVIGERIARWLLDEPQR